MPFHARPLFALLIAATAGLPAAGRQVSAGTVTRNIPYTSDSTGAYRADLYQPADGGVHPAIVAIHGGSWRTGHKTELRHLCTDLANHGYACFSIDYDTHSHSFPLSWQESRAAVAFVRAHAQEFRIDPARIAVLGTSAGGQLAALVALAPQGPAMAVPPAPTAAALPGSGPSPDATVAGPSGSSVPVDAAILFNGGYDLHPRAYLLRRYLGGRCDQIPAVCNDASPDNHIHPGAPPIFVGHGTGDHLIPYSQARTFVSLLQSAGDPVTPFVATGAGHSYWRKRGWYQRNLDATLQFLSQSLGTH